MAAQLGRHPPILLNDPQGYPAQCVEVYEESPTDERTTEEVEVDEATEQRHIHRFPGTHSKFPYVKKTANQYHMQVKKHQDHGKAKLLLHTIEVG